MTMLEKIARAIRGQLFESEEVADHVHETAALAAARAVLLAMRELDNAIKDDITISGWLEGDLKYEDVWQGTIDAILAQPYTPADVTPA